MQNKLLQVLYKGQRLGRIAETPEKLLAFEYDGEWLANGFSISPFKLPLEKRVFIAPREPFDGNFGVFNDSLPDGWGRLLIDRLLIKKGIDPYTVSTLDRLAITGLSGMGALEYLPEEKIVDDVTIDSLETLAFEVEAILNEQYEGRKLEELVKLGGSSGGARPKVLIKYNGEDWIVKFRAGTDPKNIGETEFNYMTAAGKAGLEVPEILLFEGKFFGVKRFDRKPDGNKVFMISAAGLLDASHRYPTLDYNSLLALTLELTRDFRELEKMFRLMCFNVFANNRDDHSKIFSFLYDDKRWLVSPVYDLVYSSGMGGEHATTIDGEGRNPTESHLLSAGKKAGLDHRKADKIMQEVLSAVTKAKLLP